MTFCSLTGSVFPLQLALLQEEWRGRSLSSQLMTGAEVEESSTTDGFQHPRIRWEPDVSSCGMLSGPAAV